MKLLTHSVQIADITIINRSTGKGMAYIIPNDLVLFLLWFLGSTTAQIIALVAIFLVYKLRSGWLLFLGSYLAWVAQCRQDLSLIRLVLIGLVTDLLTIQVARSFG